MQSKWFTSYFDQVQNCHNSKMEFLKTTESVLNNSVNCDVKTSLKNYNDIPQSIVYGIYTTLTVLGIFGILGNVLCVIVLLRPTMRKIPFNVLLLYAAAWDVLLLCSKMFHFLSYLLSEQDHRHFVLLVMFIISVFTTVTGIWLYKYFYVE